MGKMSQQPLERSYLKRHKNPILVLSAIGIVVIVLVSPVIPVNYVVTQTRTKKLKHSSEVYGRFNVPKIVNVTNRDTIGGSFSVSMNMWSHGFAAGQPTKDLEDTFSQSLYIKAGDTATFPLPDDWIIVQPIYSFTYSVSAPTTPENYNVTKTEYKSILNLIAESLK